MNRFGLKRRPRGRRLTLAITAVLAAALVGACGSSSTTSKNAAATSKQSKGDFTLSVGYIGQNGAMTGPEGFAYSKGLLQQWLKPAGVSAIHPAQFANGPLLTAALVGGSVDIGMVGDTPALIANSQGAPAKLINQDEVNNPAWIVAKKGGATSLSQLAGETVARPQASYIDRYLQGLLAEKGLTSKVHLVAMLPAQALPAIEAGSLDAVALPAWQLPPVIAHGAVVLAKSETTPSLQGTGVTVVADKTLAAHPGIAAAWNAARLKAVAYARAHAGAFYAYEAKSEGISSAAQAKQFLPLSGYPDANYTAAGIKQLQGTLNFLVSEKEAKPFSLTGWKAAGT